MQKFNLVAKNKLPPAMAGGTNLTSDGQTQGQGNAMI